MASSTILAFATRSRDQLSRRKQAQELQALGAYTPGINPMLDAALAIGERIDSWARQTPHEASDFETTVRSLGTALGEETIA